MVIIMIVVVTMVIMVIIVVRVASVKSSIGIFTHQGHISKVNANAQLISKLVSENLVCLLVDFPFLVGLCQHIIPHLAIHIILFCIIKYQV